MTVAQLLRDISAKELTEWRLVFEMKQAERAKAERERANR